MSESTQHFETAALHSVVTLPFDLSAMIAAWSGLQKSMVRERPEGFTREEWAYLIGFLSADNLWRPFQEAFGQPARRSRRPVNRLLRPRGPVAIWLPNNVSLLGPLTLILMTLTGNDLHLKTGTQSADLATPFLAFCRKFARGVLQTFLKERVHVHHFDRDDPRNAELSQRARIRILFGSDSAAAAVESLPHSIGSAGYSFADRRSQAWIEPKALNDAVVADLLRVFAVYGQAGCTSPHQVMLLGGNKRQALALRDALVSLWPRTIKGDPPMHQASQNVMLHQWGKMTGWDTALAPRSAAVFAVGDSASPEFGEGMVLPIIPATLAETCDRLPASIQTVGYAVTKPADPGWFKILGSTAVKRFVPIGRMHHFQAVWDGWNFWRAAFEDVEIVQSGAASRTKRRGKR